MGKNLNNEANTTDSVESAFKQLEYVSTRYKNCSEYESNRHPLGHPDRVEVDLSETSKEHLALLRSKLHMEISNKINKTLIESSESSDRLGNKVFWLNIAIAVFSAVITITSIIELSQ
jgi:hypothetical protein